MNKQDKQWSVRETFGFLTRSRHSQLATRGHRICAAGARVAQRRWHHAGSTIGARWSVFAALPRQMDVTLVLRHRRCRKYRQDERQDQWESHLLLSRFKLFWKITYSRDFRLNDFAATILRILINRSRSSNSSKWRLSNCPGVREQCRVALYFLKCSFVVNREITRLDNILSKNKPMLNFYTRTLANLLGHYHEM